MSYYQDLGVSSTASGDEIRENYHTLVRLFHPDQHTDPTLKLAAEAQMRRFNEIYAVLSDPERRRHYNSELAAAVERAAPIIIHAPRPIPDRVRVPWGTVAWGSAVVASAALILWLSNRDVAVNPSVDGATSSVIAAKPAHSESTVPAVLPPPSKDLAAQATIDDLRQQLRISNGQRDDAWRLLNQTRLEALNRHPEPQTTAHVTPPKPVETHARNEAPPTPPPARQLPQPSAMELPPALPGTLNAAPLAIAVPVRSHLAGQWLWAKPRDSNRNKALYPPEYIETTIVEQNGSLHGRYRARYQVADRAISPNVNFEFDGKSAGPSAQLPFQGDGGAKGEVRIKLISDNSIEVKWSATDLGKSLGLSAGTAVLVRKTD